MATIKDGGKAKCNENDRKVNLDLIYEDDCFESAANFLTEHVALMGGVAMAFGAALVLAASLSICLYCLIE